MSHPPDPNGRHSRPYGQPRMKHMLHRSWVVILAGLAPAPSAFAQEKKDEGKKEPRVTLVARFAVTSGSTVTLKVRGLELSEAKEVRFPDAKVPPEAEVKAKAKVP